MSQIRLEPQIEVTLSHPAYRQGGTLVGTVRAKFEGSDGSPRSLIRSLDLCVVGCCRLDPRWHDIREFQDVQSVSKNELLGGLEQDKNAVCLWATHPIDVMEYQERLVGRWDDVRPKPILHSAGHKESFVSLEGVALEDQQLSFTFQVHLPVTLPCTLQAISCRYDYHVILKVTTQSETQATWMEVPFRILTKHPSFEPGAGDDTFALNKFRLTPSQVVVHSAGLPCFLSAMELNRPDGTVTVNRYGASYFRHIRRDDGRHLQTLRVADPSGKPVCILSVIGVSPIHPGSRLVLKFDLPLSRDWVPCHQVSACLQGEEIAIRRDGSCKRSRSYLLSTAHSYIQPQCTEQAALHLSLPLDAPCTTKTDVVSISIRCLVDISVELPEQAGQFQNLRLEIPCDVTHSMAAYEMSDDIESLDRNLSIDELIGSPKGGDHLDDSTSPSSFQSKGISEDLKILSLHLADSCGLIPSPPRQFEI